MEDLVGNAYETLDSGARLRDLGVICKWKHPGIRGVGVGVGSSLSRVGSVSVACEGIIRDHKEDVPLSWQKRALGCEQD